LIIRRASHRARQRPLAPTSPRRCRVAAIALCCLWLLLGLASAASGADIVRGQSLYRQYCASCHGTNPALGSPANAANNPGVISQAIQSEGQMGFLSALVNANDRIDIAAYIGSVVSPPPAFEPQSGWYWNASESGRGFFIERRNASVFMAGFHYAADGRATWFTAQGTVLNNTLNSPMSMFSGGQTLTGAYVGPQAAASPGNLRVDFLSATTANLNWPGGVVALTRFPLTNSGVAAPQAGAPQSGWWWYEAEAGRGFAIEFQADAVFIAGFMYAANGDPTWYVSNGIMSSPSRYAGEWLAFTNGQAMGAPWRDATITVPHAGSLLLQFSDATHGNLTLPDGRIVPLTRFIF
jgi:Cytochrome C oxidase, cbb3-type, subunit III